MNTYEHEKKDNDRHHKMKSNFRQWKNEKQSREAESEESRISRKKTIIQLVSISDLIS